LLGQKAGDCFGEAVPPAMHHRQGVPACRVGSNFVVLICEPTNCGCLQDIVSMLALGVLSVPLW
jgi:hypothetical protein